MMSRICAFAIAALALAALRAQYDVLPYGAAANSLAQRLWILGGYFTVLTNALVAIAMLAITKGWHISASRAAGLLVSILMVGIVYHLVLAALWNPVGLAWWANQGLHTAVPLATLAWWLAFAPKPARVMDLPKWLVWPMVYCVYAVIRGSVTGFWPYPFLDIDQLGALRVWVNILGLILAFTVLGLGVAALSKFVSKPGQPDKPS